jgi:CO dehydrogenase maturation factor
MKIAFIGKGGSGKTTMAALFAHHLNRTQQDAPILTIDADINSHLAKALGLDSGPLPPPLSSSESADRLKKHIWNNNPRISKAAEIKKTTPPTAESGFFWLVDENNLLFQDFCVREGQLRLARVGTYESEGIGRSCYHNSLAILENVLSHSISDGGFLVVDMVAGTDAFASSMHAQFDVLVFAAEPTAKSLAVFNDYARLAESAGIADRLYAIGNKALDSDDRHFLASNIPQDKLLGVLGHSRHLRSVERDETEFDFDQMETETKEAMATVLATLTNNVSSYNERLEQLHRLHHFYVAQGYVRDRFGDLTNQIDESFDFDEYIRRNRDSYGPNA